MSFLETFPDNPTKTIVKTATESRVNTVTSAIDSELKADLEASTSYSFTAFLAVRASGAAPLNNPDFRVQIVAPVGTTLLAEIAREDNSSNIGTMTAVNTDLSGLAQNGGLKNYVITGTITMGATAGEVGIGWAQDILDADTNTDLQANSHLTFIKVI